MEKVYVLDEKSGWLFERERLPRKRFIFKEVEKTRLRKLEIEQLERLYGEEVN